MQIGISYRIMTAGFDFDSYWKAWILSRLAMIEKNIAAYKAIKQAQQSQGLQPVGIQPDSSSPLLDQSQLIDDQAEF